MDHPCTKNEISVKLRFNSMSTMLQKKEYDLNMLVEKKLYFQPLINANITF